MTFNIMALSSSTESYFAFSYSHADCHYAECYYSGCCCAECHGALTIFFLFHLQILDELENYLSDTNTLAYFSLEKNLKHALLPILSKNIFFPIRVFPIFQK
jgi:hypothetical protein